MWATGRSFIWTGRLADDWFTNGETWHAALKRFDYPASLVLRIYSSDSPIPNPYDNQVYYDLPVEKGCALRGVKAVAEYKQNCKLYADNSEKYRRKKYR